MPGADGNTVYCGRKNSQVELRDQRIELGEVENVINNHQSILPAAVLIRNFHDAVCRRLRVVQAFRCRESRCGEGGCQDLHLGAPFKAHVPIAHCTPPPRSWS